MWIRHRLLIHLFRLAFTGESTLLGARQNLKSDYGRCPSWQRSLSLWHKLLSPFLEVSTARAACCPALCPLLADNVIHQLVAGLDTVHPYIGRAWGFFLFIYLFIFYFFFLLLRVKCKNSFLRAPLRSHVGPPLSQLLFAEILSNQCRDSFTSHRAQWDFVDSEVYTDWTDPSSIMCNF